jgi:SNF2 family DNA or RNA helicase
MRYEPKTTPYQYQKEVLESSWDRPYYALFLEMGTGKSKVTIDTMAALFEAGEIDTALIIAPKGVYGNWVHKEIPQHLPDRIERQILQWQPNFTKKYTEAVRRLAYREFREGRKLHILVMNTEALQTEKGYKSALRFLTLNPDSLTVIDESTSIKTPSAKRTKNALKIGEASKYKRILTGSPVTKSPMDLYSQCHFLSPRALGFRSYYAFQNRYAKIVRRNMGSTSFNEIVGYQRLDELADKLNEFSVRILKEDCLDLPDKVYMRREVELTKEQRRYYDQMKTLALAQLESGELVTTQSVLTQILRLQQICCGFVQPDEGPLIELPSNRMDALHDLIEEVQGKAIIWANFTHDIERITSTLRKKYGSRSVVSYYGKTDDDARQQALVDFQDPESPVRFFVGQPRTGGRGLTLTEAKTVIYYSCGYDLEIRLQSEDRAHRIGQTEKVTYVDILTPGTVDEKVIDALRKKINLASRALGEEAREWLI